MNARKQYKKLVKKKKSLLKASEKSRFNTLTLSKDKRLGIIACGIGLNYVLETITDDIEFYSLLKISQYPIPRKKIQEIYDHCEEVIVVEEGFPMVEELLKDFLDREKKIRGKLSGDLPPVGELNPNAVAKGLGFYQERVPDVSDVVVPRPPQLCEGCGHSDLFKVIQELVPETGKKRVFGDIGCYALGAITPEHPISTLIDMGASITMAKGAADAGVENAIAVIGDSTFAHSGMTGLLEAVVENSPITVIISDNSAVAMTGAQESLAVGRIKNICLGIGVEPEHVKTIVPLKKNHESNVRTLREEIGHRGVSVIISQRPCIRLSKDIKQKIKNKVASLN
jgi:indolepyruvate ferredoxin oxidoreductase alpha subunit